MDKYKEDTIAMIEGKENRNVDFKETDRGIEPEDIVAFANAEGGTLLIGVKEIRDATGMQRGEVIGWVGDFDKANLSIQTKATHCRPPVNVEVEREYDGEHHILRIDVAECKDKPCCTQKGIYKMRGDGGNKPITPTEMTVLILEKEANEFVTRLQDAGSKFVEDIVEGQKTLAKMILKLESIAERTERAAASAAGSAEEAARSADQAVSTGQEIIDAVYDRE